MRPVNKVLAATCRQQRMEKTNEFEYVLVSLDKAAALWYTPDHE
jgi:hypothetical protein